MMWTPREWNVETKGRSLKDKGRFSSVSFPMRSNTLFRISLAALFVNVMARISEGFTPDFTKWRILWVIVLVLPAPAPAKMSKGPAVLRTADFCLSFKPRRWFTERF